MSTTSPTRSPGEHCETRPAHSVSIMAQTRAARLPLGACLVQQPWGWDLLCIWLAPSYDLGLGCSHQQGHAAFADATLCSHGYPWDRPYFQVMLHAAGFHPASAGRSLCSPGHPWDRPYTQMLDAAGFHPASAGCTLCSHGHPWDQLYFQVLLDAASLHPESCR